MDDMPKLFDVDIKDKDEEKATKFISNLQDMGFVGVNETYLKNYIDSDIGIALSHIRNGYKKYVCKGNWSEEKFQEVIYIIVRHRQMLIPAVFLKYGIKYDDGELTKEINLEKRKYSKAVRNEERSENSISKEEQDLLDYIAKHGG